VLGNHSLQRGQIDDRIRGPQNHEAADDSVKATLDGIDGGGNPTHSNSDAVRELTDLLPGASMKELRTRSRTVVRSSSEPRQRSTTRPYFPRLAGWQNFRNLSSSPTRR
jgi:hypothetical protein